MAKVQINGRFIAYEIAGSGPVSVILETGIGAEGSEWSPIASVLAGRTRVLWYDRAGRGSSEVVQGPRSVQAIVGDLNALLDIVGLTPPFLFVGHSFGGVLARAFAHTRRSEMCGLVLAESMHPKQFDVLGPAFPDPSPADTAPLVQMREFWKDNWKSLNSTPEHIDFVQAFEKDQVLAGSLGSLPVQVLTAASFENAPFIRVPSHRSHLQRLWNKLQGELEQVSERTEAVYLEDSGHFIQRDRPDAITMAVHALLNAL